jgi:hypothetical protein
MNPIEGGPQNKEQETPENEFVRLLMNGKITSADRMIEKQVIEKKPFSREFIVDSALRAVEVFLYMGKIEDAYAVSETFELTEDSEGELKRLAKDQFDDDTAAGKTLEALKIAEKFKILKEVKR